MNARRLSQKVNSPSAAREMTCSLAFRLEEEGGTQLYRHLLEWREKKSSSPSLLTHFPASEKGASSFEHVSRQDSWEKDYNAISFLFFPFSHLNNSQCPLNVDRARSQLRTTLLGAQHRIRPSNVPSRVKARALILVGILLSPSPPPPSP